MMYNAMDDFLRRSLGGKKLHDPLALAVALDESVCELVEVKLFCQKGKWGSRLCPGSGTWISTAHNAQQFQRVLLEGPCTGVDTWTARPQVRASGERKTG